MHKVQLTSGCKINLYLRVGQKRPSGYHDLDTLFVPLSHPCDEMTITSKPQGFKLLCDNKAVDPINNTLSKAFTKYTQSRPLTTGLSVELTKRVPIGGGLGGGSANAAALLKYMQTLPAQNAMPPLSAEKLGVIATSIGADVPFFLAEGCQLARGIGEKLSPCENPFQGYFLLLICPQIPISTAWAFAELSALREKKEVFLSNNLTCSAHHDSNTSSQARAYINDFEEVVYKAHPELKRIKENLLQNGAEVALLSGTGASLFGIFKKEDFAQKVIDKTVHSVYLVKL